jgi:haloalkane dehalogenase
MEFVRTPDDRFENLDGYPFEPNYVAVPDDEGGTLRMHYVDVGPRDGEIVLCLHGQPTWSYLYRKMIPLLTSAGHRVIAPDFIGFGRSDKPVGRHEYTYARHVGWVESFLTQLELTGLTLVCQDWGGLIGLRAVASMPERFARVVTANTGLPTAQGIPAEMAPKMHEIYAGVPVVSVDELPAKMQEEGGPGFMYWIKFCAETPNLVVSQVVGMSGGRLNEAEARAYDAPFPDDTYKSGARQFPSLVPIFPDNEAIDDNQAAWRVLEKFDKPFLTAFSDSDPVTAGGEQPFRERVPGAKGQNHVTIEGAGHFLQEDKGEELANVVIDFIAANPAA